MPRHPASRPLALAAPLIAGPSAAVHWRVLGVLLLVAVMVLALSPNPPQGMTTGWDKANHALAFMALAFTSRLGFPGGWGRWLGVAIAMLVLGGLIEVGQHFVPGRQADWIDLVADAAGAGAGLLMSDALLWALRSATVRP